MTNKSKEEYPFKVETLIPKGSSIGSKKQATIRTAFYKDRETAQKDCDAWLKAGLLSKVINR
jgi:hypothetical protein